MDTAEGKIQRFVQALQWQAVPGRVQQTAHRTFADAVGVLLSGANTPQHAILLAAAEKGGGVHFVAGAGAVATGLYESVFLNAACAHAEEYNDLFYCQPGHPSASLVPMLLNLAEELDADGGQVMAAYVAGFEVMACVNRALLPASHRRGFHTTSVAGTLGCAAAAAKLLGLRDAALRWAVGLAATFACGLRQNFGTTANSAHVGIAAINGLRAAKLAKAGLKPADHLLETGFSACLGANPVQLADGAALLGRQWAFETPGVLIKKYPCCYSAYQAIEAALQIAREPGFCAGDIAGIGIETSENHYMSLPRRWPEDLYSQRFCVPYCVAVALQDGKLDAASFAAQAHRRPELVRLSGLTEYGVDPGQKGEEGFGHTAVTVALRGGARLSAVAYPQKGDRAERWTQPALMEKFRRCTAARLEPSQADALFCRLLRLGPQDRVRSLVAQLAGDPPADR